MIRRGVFLFALIGAALWLPRAAMPAPAPACPPYGKAIKFDFKTLAPRPTYNNRLNVTGIRNLFREHTNAAAAANQRALGITYAQTAIAIEGSSMYRPMRGGNCVYLAEVTVEFGWRRMEVYVANEFAPGTCEYRAVLDHENQHVAINSAVLKEHAPRLRAFVEQLLAEQRPVFSRDPQVAGDNMLRALNERINPMLDRFQDAMAARNAPLDTPGSYGEIQKLCKNWNGPPAK